MQTMTRYDKKTGEVLGTVSVPAFAVAAQAEDDDIGLIDGRFNRKEHRIENGKVKLKNKKHTQ